MDDTHAEWRRSVRGFVDKEIMPFVDEWEEAGRIPRELFKKANQAGLLGIGYPTEYGGEGTEFDRFHGIVTSDELARIGAGGISSRLNWPSILLSAAISRSPWKTRMVTADWLSSAVEKT